MTPTHTDTHNEPISEAAQKRVLSTLRHYGFTYIDHVFEGVDSQKVQSDGVNQLHSHESHILKIGKQLAEHAKYLKQSHAFVYDIHERAVKKQRETVLSLHVAGAKQALSDATVIAVSRAILKEVGIPETVVAINAIGTPDAHNRYAKDLTQYLKKSLTGGLAESVMELIHKDPRKVLSKLAKDCHECIADAPNPMDYLNDESREHVRSLLEYLEHSGIPYTFDHTITGSPDYFEQVLFEIRNAKPESTDSKTLARGGRYSLLHRRAFKQHVESTGMTIPLLFSESVITQNTSTHSKNSLSKRARFFFAHVSDTAKRLVLPIMEKLRIGGVKVDHALTADTLSDQMKSAHGAEYVVIVGHKEALEKTAIVREVKSRVQEEVPIEKLSDYLKKL